MNVNQPILRHLVSKAGLTTVGALLAAAVVAQANLQARFESEESRPANLLTVPLDSLPARIGPWIGQAEEIEQAKTISSAHLYRRYTHVANKQPVFVWIVFSEHGEDRGHHPEVCMAVAGKQEVPNTRGQISVPPHAAPIQEYKFQAEDGELGIFYWNYWVPAESTNTMDALSRLYHRTRTRRPSLDIEVLARGGPTKKGAQVRQFVRLLDEAIQPMLTDQVVRRNQRLPVAILRSAATPGRSASTP